MGHYLVHCNICGRKPQMTTTAKNGTFVCTIRCKKRFFNSCADPVFSAEAQNKDRAEFYAALAWNQYMCGLSREAADA